MVEKVFSPAAGDVPGASQIDVKVEGNLVLYVFDRPTHWFKLTAAEAASLSEYTARAAYSIHSGQPAGIQAPGASALLQSVRQRAVTRVELMLVSLREQNRDPKYMAEAIVDTVMAYLA
jgi:hypothetical protein